MKYADGHILSHYAFISHAEYKQDTMQPADSELTAAVGFLARPAVCILDTDEHILCLLFMRPENSKSLGIHSAGLIYGIQWSTYNNISCSSFSEEHWPVDILVNSAMPFQV